MPGHRSSRPAKVPDPTHKWAVIVTLTIIIGWIIWTIRGA